LEVEFDMTAEDVLAFQRYHQAHPWKANRTRTPFSPPDLMLFLHYGGVVLGVTLFAFLMQYDIRDALSLLLVGMAASVWSSVMTLLFLRLKQPDLLRHSMQQRLGETDRQRLILTPEGVVHSSPRGRGVNYWSCVKRLGVADEHLFIYISSVSAYTVPRRAFVDDESFRAFIAEAERLLQDAHAAPGGARWRAATEVLDALPASGPTDQPQQPKGDFAENPERLQGTELPAKEG
jgi:hypothetical protein